MAHSGRTAARLHGAFGSHGCTAAHLELKEAFLLHGGGDLGAEAGGERRLVCHHQPAGLTHGLDDLQSAGKAEEEEASGSVMEKLGYDEG